jgi:peptidoglycan/LPS O-acetylase OafA/YrhL
MGLVRLWLALCVATAHIAVFVFPGVDGAEQLFLNLGGGRAVMLFFTVSGFLMSFVLDHKYSCPGGTLRYYRARFLRIYSLWWAMFAIMLVFFGKWWFYKPIPDFLSSFTLLGLDWRIAFTTYPEPYAVLSVFPTLGIGWSLAPEVAFYIIAPFVLRSLALSIGVFTLSVMIRYSILEQVLYGPKWICLAYSWFPSLTAFFILGHFSRLIWKRLPLDPRFGLLFIPAAIALIQKAPIGYFDSPWFYASLICFALALPPIFDLTKDTKWMNAAGDLTYPLYLTHYSVIYLALLGAAPLAPQIKQVFEAIPLPQFGQFTVLAVVGNAIFLLVAFGAHRLIEQPTRQLLEIALVLPRRWRRAPITAVAAQPAA